MRRSGARLNTMPQLQAVQVSWLCQAHWTPCRCFCTGVVGLSMDRVQQAIVAHALNCGQYEEGRFILVSNSVPKVVRVLPKAGKLDRMGRTRYSRQQRRGPWHWQHRWSHAQRTLPWQRTPAFIAFTFERPHKAVRASGKTESLHLHV